MRHAFLWIKSATLTVAAVACLIASSAPAAHAQDVFGSMIGALTGGIGSGTKSTKSGDGAPNKNDSVEGMQERRYSYLESAEGAGARASTQPSYGYGGSDVRDAKGAAQPGMIAGARLNGTLYSEVPMLPLAGINFPVASKAQENEMYKHCPPLTGYHLTDSADYINTAIANDVLLGKLSDPERWVNVSKATQQAQNTQMGNALAELTRNQANSAIDFCSTYLTNFTTSKQWNAVRDKLFIPIALLLLLPGAMLSQVKAIIAAGTPVLEETQPFEGLLRSIVAIFLIPATCLVLNYGIDLSNSLTYTIKTQYKAIFGDDMYESAICAEVRAFPVRQEAENRGALDVQTSKMGQLLPEAKTTFAKVEGQLFSTKLEDPCAGLYVAPSDRVDEALPTNVVAARLAFNGINAALTCGWNALCAFQVVYLYYLWLMGPIVAALWVWPMKMFRDALPSWIEGCVTLCFWSLLWNTTILLMACFRGYDETGTIMMTAMNTLATLCVKCAFDFVGLVAAAGQQASSIGAKMSEAIGKGAAGAGGTSGHGATGRSSAGLGGHGSAMTHVGGSSVHGGNSVVHGGEGAASVLGSHGGTTGSGDMLGSHGGANRGNGAGGMHLSGAPNGHLSLTSHSINPSGLGSTQIHNSAISSGLSSHIQPPPGTAAHGLIGGVAGGENVHSALGNIMHNTPEGFSLPPSSVESISSPIGAATSEPPGIAGFDVLNDMANSASTAVDVVQALEPATAEQFNFAQMPEARMQDAIFNTMNASAHLGGGTDIFNNATMEATGGAIPGANSFVSNNLTENAGVAAVWNSVDGSQIDLGLDVADDMSQVNLDNGIDIAAETVMANGDFQVDMDQVFDNSSAVVNAGGGPTVIGAEQRSDAPSAMNNSVSQNAVASDIINNTANLANVNDSIPINNAGSMAMMNASNFSNAVANDFSSSVVNAGGYSYSSSDANSYNSSAYTMQTAAYSSDIVNSMSNVANNVGNMIQSSVAGDVVNNGGNMQSSINAVNAAEIYNQQANSNSSYAEYAQQQIQQYQQYQQQAQITAAAYYTDNSTSSNIAASAGREMQSSIANSLTNDVVQRTQEQQQMYANVADVQSVQQPATVGASACTTFTATTEVGGTASGYLSAAAPSVGSGSAPSEYISTAAAPSVGSGSAPSEYISTATAPSVGSGSAPSEYISTAAAPSVGSGSAPNEYISTAAAPSIGSGSAPSEYISTMAAPSVANGSASSEYISSATPPTMTSVGMASEYVSAVAAVPASASAQVDYAAAANVVQALAPTAAEAPTQYNSAGAAGPVNAPEVVVVPTSNFSTARPAALEEVVKQSLASNPKEGKEMANSDKAEPLYAPSAKPQSRLTSALRSAACPAPQNTSQAIPIPPSSTATPVPEEPATTGNTVFSPLDIAAGTTRNRYRGQRKMTEEELRQLEESTRSWWT